MSNTLARRAWLKQSSLALAGIGLGNRLFAADSTYTAEKIKRVTPPGIIKLSSNENPYGPSPLARRAMADAISQSNRYPWSVTEQLLGKIGEQYGLTDTHVLMGAGSSEILGLVSILAAMQKGNAVCAFPTFTIWWRVLQKLGLEIIKVPLTADKKHDLPAMLSAINGETRLVYVCNPNNPTGTVLPFQELKSFVEEASKKAIVLLDEAYTEYSGALSLASMVATNKNLVIAKTFSKIYGMAGARIGFALAHPDIIASLEALQPWANAGPGGVSLAGALASLDDVDFVKMSKANNQAAREYVEQQFKTLKVPFIPSNTNFIYYSLQQYAGNIEEAFKQQQIITRGIVEEDGKWVRTSIGTQQEMQQFITVLKNMLHA